MGADWTMTRRGLLLAAGAAATLGPRRLRAQALAERPLGAGVLATFSDGGMGLPPGEPVTLDADPEAVAALRAEAGIAAPELRPVTVTLLRAGERVILFDCGSGSNFLPTLGRLPAALEAVGVAPEDVTDVALTHAHPDHLWGALNDFDEVAFPNATFHAPQAEVDFWLSDGAPAAVGPARESFVVGARARLTAIAEQLRLFAPGAEVAPGVEAVATPGHTPGHVSFMLHGGETPVLVGGDALVDPVLSFRRPLWRSPMDQDPAMAAETRVKLLARLADDHAALIGYHLPEPGFGRVERLGDAFAWVAA